jgi:tetratricopeptide (TPR) repeat protein
VSSRSRVFMLVAVAATAASGVVVVGVLATHGHVPGPPTPREGRPPLALDFGVRTDAEARALERAQTLYRRGEVDRAATTFGHYRSLEADVGAAMAAWPGDTVSRLQELQAEHPGSSLVALHLGLTLYWARRDAEALAAWRAAARHQPDTFYAVRAGDFLHPQFAPGLPRFVPSFEPPPRIKGLPGPQQVAALRRAAARGGAHAKLLYGAALQELSRPVSAERQFAAATRLAPDDPDARAAAAVGLFDKANPSRAFSRLGPLTRVFPHAQTVRFHLGLLLVWSAQVREARRQLKLAEREDPNSLLGRQAASYLAALRKVGTR